jgi:hypothetical protein
MPKQRGAKAISPAEAYNDDHTPAQRELFALEAKYEKRLSRFYPKDHVPGTPGIGNPIVWGTPEHDQYQAICAERERARQEWRERNGVQEGEKAPHSPGNLLAWIEGKLVLLDMIQLAYPQGGYPNEQAQGICREAFDFVLDIARKQTGLPGLPERLADPRITLDNLRRWCVEANRPEAGHLPESPTAGVIGPAGGRPAGSDGASLPPLTDKAAAVLELLKALPCDRGMTGPAILDALNNRQPPMNFDQSTLTARIIPELKPRGVKNRRGVGYYIDPSKRSNGAVSTHS